MVSRERLQVVDAGVPLRVLFAIVMAIVFALSVLFRSPTMEKKKSRKKRCASASRLAKTGDEARGGSVDLNRFRAFLSGFPPMLFLHRFVRRQV